jgi:2-keto-4-pentenoate hydratase/2-oxohepta-3-ene-1,7-dioic acid hydratase in catechol pathway
MKLVSFRRLRDGPGDGPGETTVHAGIVDGDEVVDLGDRPMPAALADGLEALRAGAAAASTRHPLADVQLVAPVPRPPKLLAIGLNYAAHVAETGGQRPEFQTWFNKQSTCVVGPGAPIHVPKVSTMVDYEGELAFVIGRRCRHVPAAQAADVIAGYTVMNDVSVRDWQLRVPTWVMGKGFDTHGPMGPWIVTTDELGDPHALRLRTWVNDELRQDARTDDLIFDCFAMVEHLSTAFTLEPGDVISTGTPAGVAMGMNPPRWLQPGDTVRIEIEGIGSLENPVIAEP